MNIYEIELSQFKIEQKQTPEISVMTWAHTNSSELTNKQNYAMLVIQYYHRSGEYKAPNDKA